MVNPLGGAWHLLGEANPNKRADWIISQQKGINEQRHLGFNHIPLHLDPLLFRIIRCQGRDMRRGLDDRNGGWRELASFADQYQGHVDLRG